MKTTLRFLTCGLVVVWLAGGGVRRLTAEEAGQDRSIVVGKFKMTAPADWVRRKPKTRIVEHEFAAKASEGDDGDGRVTMMFSGGSIDDNISRWRGQFAAIDGNSPEKPEERKIAGQPVHIVDILGTWVDMASAERENYRMLGAIIELADGNYFVKFVGPRRTVTDHEKNFLSLLESLEVK